jgi:hypothetical protein
MTLEHIRRAVADARARCLLAGGPFRHGLFGNWFRMSLGQEFALTAAHERRHLWQASRVREKIEGGHHVHAGSD